MSHIFFDTHCGQSPVTSKEFLSHVQHGPLSHLQTFLCSNNTCNERCCMPRCGASAKSKARLMQSQENAPVPHAEELVLALSLRFASPKRCSGSLWIARLLSHRRRESRRHPLQWFPRELVHREAARSL